MKLTKILSKKLLHDYKRFKMFGYHIQLPTGVETDFTMKESGEYAIVIPILNDGKFIMVKQHRLGADKISIEFPMGNVSGVLPEEMAKTELREETGYIAEEMKKIFDFYISPGWSNQRGHLFVARGLKEGEKDLEPYEYIENSIFTEGEIETMIGSGEIFDASTILSFYHYKRLFG